MTQGIPKQMDQEGEQEIIKDVVVALQQKDKVRVELLEKELLEKQVGENRN